jgi:hypothetical protein
MAVHGQSWRVDVVEQEPTKTLDAWFVMEVPLDGPERPWTCHLLGYRLEGCKAQVSAPVEVIDPGSRRALTRSGTAYKLGERSGFNADAFWLWGVWKRRFGIQQEREVTEEVEAVLWQGQVH